MAKAKFNKKQLLKKFVEFPKTGIRHFFSKEMSLLNILIERYSIDFLNVLTLNKKYDSLAIILCDSYKPEIDKKYRSFNYKTDDSLYDKIETTSVKSGEDVEIKIKPKTIKDFLNG